MQHQHSTAIPSFRQTVSAVDPLSDLVYGAMEKAAAKTREFFDTEKKDHDPFLAPCLMRFFTKHGLRDSGIQTEEDGEVSDFEGLPNNGLAFFYKHHHVRILKAALVREVPWKLPGCGVSAPKQNFYNQQLEFYVDPKGSMHTSVLNIVYLWDFDPLFRLAGLYLACPLAAGVYAKDVQEHWREELRHPAFSRTEERQTSSESNRSDEAIEELLRLPEEDDEATKKA